MTYEEMKAMGIVKKQGRKGTRFLLKDKDICGKERYVTLHITDKSSRKEIAAEIEKAKILLKKDSSGIKKLILAWHEARGHAHETRRSTDYSLRGISLEPNADRILCINIASDVSIKPSSRALRISHIRSFFKWLISTGIQCVDPTTGVCVKCSKTPRKRVLTDEEISYLISKIENDHDVNLLFLLMLHTGCRISTAMIYTPDSWDEGTKTLSMFNKKANKPYSYKIPIVDETLISMLKVGFVGDPVKAKNRLVHIMYKIGPDKSGERVSPHTLRHTWATKALQAGVPIDVISHILDHASISITLAIYARHSIEQLSSAVLAVSNLIPKQKELK